MPQFLKQFLIWVREFWDDHGQSNGSFGIGLMGGAGRLAQSPNGPRPGNGQSLDRYSGTSGTAKPHKYSPDEVKRILRGLERGDHARLVLVQAATFSSLLDDRMIRYFRGRERLFDRLPYVLLQYMQGKPSDDIAQSVSFFSHGEDVEEAMDFAARLITLQVNRQR